MRSRANSERGAATLVFTIAILLLGTLAVFGLAQAVLMQQKIANNDVRAAQAFEAAEAGLHAALDYLGDDPDRDGNGALDPVFDTNGDGIGDASTAMAGSGSIAVTTQDLSAGAMTRIAVTALGYSDDRSTRRTVVQGVVALDPLPHVPRYPLIVGGAFAIRGTAFVRNAYGHDALWSGAAAHVHDGGALTTMLPDTTSPAYPECLAHAAGCAPGAAAFPASTGIVANDATLGTLEPDTLFRHVFGLAPESFAASLVTRRTTPAAFDTDARLAGRATIHVDGSLHVGNVTIGCRVAVTGSSPCPGAQRKPAVVIVAGDAEVANAAHLYGLLFVSGTLTVTGELSVHGAVVAAGDVVVGNSAAFDVHFDTAVLDQLHRAGPMVPLAGSWQER